MRMLMTLLTAGVMVVSLPYVHVGEAASVEIDDGDSLVVFNASVVEGVNPSEALTHIGKTLEGYNCSVASISYFRRRDAVRFFFGANVEDEATEVGVNTSSRCSELMKSIALDQQYDLEGRCGLKSGSVTWWSSAYARPQNQSRWNFIIRGDDERDTGRADGYLLSRPSHTSAWGSVCGDEFGNHEAIVACKSLGFNEAHARVVQKTYALLPDLPMYMSSSRCEGNLDAQTIASCDYSFSSEFSATETGCMSNVLLDCREPPKTDPSRWKLRLAPVIEGLPHVGRLEIQPNNDAEWGTVCDDGFNSKAALAACRSLGYSNITHASFISMADHQGSGTIYLDQINCTNAERFEDCAYVYSTADQKLNDCRHYEDVGIDCRGIVPTNDAPIIGFIGTFNATEISPSDVVRRISSTLEIALYRIRVINVSSSLPHLEPFQKEVHFRFLDPPIDLWNSEPPRDQLDMSLVRYPRNLIGKYFGLIALYSNRTAYQTKFHVRLSFTGFTNVGRIEVRPRANNESEWGTICSDGNFEIRAAMAACRSAGFDDISEASLVFPTKRAGTGPVYISVLDCAEENMYLENCTYEEKSVTSCGHSQDAWVQCGPRQIPRQLKFALSPAESPRNDAGLLRVQLYDGGPWDYVCSYSLVAGLRRFDESDAKRACRTLGFPDVTPKLMASAYSLPVPVMYGLANLQCPVSATNITECKHFYDSENLYGGFCLFGSPVAINCNSASSDLWQYRLVTEHPTKPHRGRFEMRPTTASEWGTICSDDFDDYAAQFACSALGMPTAKAFAINRYGQGNASSPIWLDNVKCTADSNDFSNCSFIFSPPGERRNNCQHWEDVGIDCSGNGRQVPNAIEFTALAIESSEKVAQNIAEWLYIESERVIITNSHVNEENLTRMSFYFTEKIATDQPFSTTRAVLENALLNLRPNERLESLGIPYLTNNVSEEVKNTMSLRLVPASDESGHNIASEGRVEFRPDEFSSWGTICDDGIDEHAANSLCRSLNFPRGGVVISNTPFNDQTLHIYLDNTECQATNHFYQNCTFSLSTIDRIVTDCSGRENLAIRCFDDETTDNTTSQSETGKTSYSAQTNETTAPHTSTSTSTTSPTTTTTDILTSATSASTTSVTDVTSVTDQPTPTETLTTSTLPAPTTTARRPSSGNFSAVLRSTTNSSLFRNSLIELLNTEESCFEELYYIETSRGGHSVAFRFVDRDDCREDPESIARRLAQLWATRRDQVSTATGVESLNAPKAEHARDVDDDEATRKILYIAVGSGVACVCLVMLIVGVVLFKIRSRVTAEEFDRYDEDYIAMNDYRQSAI